MAGMLTPLLCMYIHLHYIIISLIHVLLLSCIYAIVERSNCFQRKNAAVTSELLQEVHVQVEYGGATIDDVIECLRLFTAAGQMV